VSAYTNDLTWWCGLVSAPLALSGLTSAGGRFVRRAFPAGAGMTRIRDQKSAQIVLKVIEQRIRLPGLADAARVRASRSRSINAVVRQPERQPCG
jgi:hypothetical protein